MPDGYRYKALDCDLDGWPSEDLYLSQIKSLATDHPNARVLDVGSGLGRIIEIVRPYIGSLVGLEPDPERFRACRDRYRDDDRIRIIAATSCEYRRASPPERFGIIIVSMVLQHVARAICHQILNDVHSLLQPNGKVIVATTHTIHERFSFQNDSTSRTAEEFDLYALDTENQRFGIPVREFSKYSLCQTIDAAGLTITQWREFSFVPPEKIEWFSGLLKVSPKALKTMGISQYAIARRKNHPGASADAR